MKKVAIYSTPTCHFCHDAKDFFTEHNVPFEDYNVASDAARREEMIKKTGKLAVPVITITDEAGNEEVIVGYDQSRIAGLLGL